MLTEGNSAPWVEPLEGQCSTQTRKCGPRCAICGTTPSQQRFTHSVDIDKWNSLQHTNTSRLIETTACVCWSCVRRLRKPLSTINKQNVIQCSTSTCENEGFCKGLCRQHYREDSSCSRLLCSTCSKRIKAGEPWRKTPNIALLRQIIGKEDATAIDITCNVHYKAQCQIMSDNDKDGEKISTDYKLNKLLNNLQGSACAPITNTAVFTAD